MNDLQVKENTLFKETLRYPMKHKEIFSWLAVSGISASAVIVLAILGR